MRRIVVVATAVAVLVAAASAYAATGGLNSYTATLKFSPNKASTPLGFTQKYIANGTSGNRTAPLTDIKTVIYGVKSDGKDFPTCSKAKIVAAGNDTVCPKAALVATGSVTAILGPAADQSASAPGQLPCDPVLDVWNAGQGQLTYFFVDEGSHTCAGGAITTGEVGPFTGTVKTVGKNLVMDTPIPSYVSFPLSGVEGSLTSETLIWKNASIKLKNGKTAHFGTSVACKGGKRPYTVTFTAETGPGGTSSSTPVTGVQKCS
ncbi:MAG TPA: hypothetical protein VMA96_13305 [Solirubrobacteraceae bacterium]|nr:hypothetical protein [Solirubrobacteraceae bacterium]